MKVFSAFRISSFYFVIIGITIPTFFLCFLIKLAFYYPLELSHLFPLFLGTGFFLSSIFQKKGLFLSLLLAISFVLIDWSHFSSPPFWKIALFLSCILTFFTAYIASEIVLTIWQAVQKKQKRKRNHFSWIKNRFNKRAQEYESSILLLQEKVQELENHMNIQSQQLHERDVQIKNMQTQVGFVLNQKQQLISEAFSARKELAIEKQRIENSDKNVDVVATSEYKKLEEKFRNEKSLHLQLRSQFSEKTELLAQTRKELFQSETENLSNKALPIEETVVEKNLTIALKQSYQELEMIQLENRLLEELVTQLSS